MEAFQLLNNFFWKGSTFDEMEAGKYYHVYNRGNNREAIFKESKNYEFFLKRYREYLSSLVDTFCYCLMPNHFHLLVRPKDHLQGDEVAKAFKNFFISYSKAINKSYDRTGSLFQSKFKRKEVDSDAYLSMIIAYLHLNPLRAGMVKDLKDWQWSSYRSILSNKPTVLKREEVINWFGGL